MPGGTDPFKFASHEYEERRPYRHIMDFSRAIGTKILASSIIKNEFSMTFSEIMLYPESAANYGNLAGRANVSRAFSKSEEGYSWWSNEVFSGI